MDNVKLAQFVAMRLEVYREEWQKKLGALAERLTATAYKEHDFIQVLFWNGDEAITAAAALRHTVNLDNELDEIVGGEDNTDVLDLLDEWEQHHADELIIGIYKDPSGTPLRRAVHCAEHEGLRLAFVTVQDLHRRALDQGGQS